MKIVIPRKDSQILGKVYIFRGLLISFFIHFIAVFVIRISGFEIDFLLLYNIIIGKELAITNKELSSYFLEFCLYIFTLTLFYFIITKGAKRYIIGNNLDVKWYSLRAANYWFLIFSARYLDTRIKGGRQETDIIFIDVLSDKNIVYSGYLFDFNYNPHKNELENIVLKTVSKRTYYKANEDDHELTLSEAKQIAGDAFIIPFHQVTNINLYT